MIRKIIPYIIILIALVGLLGPGGKASAQSADGKGTCYDSDKKPTTLNEIQCGLNTATLTRPAYYWIATGATDPSDPIKSDVTAPQKPSDSSEFEKNIDSGCDSLWRSSFSGCILKLFYYTYFQLPSFVLWLSALFFNALTSLVIQSAMYTAPFIATAWGVVRDLSNIFFILILLYIAIKIILDLGGHEAKKMIANVIIVALLINFSMFFTKVVIDTSNVLALIFYTKLDTKTKNPDGKPRDYTPSTPNDERDISGAMYKNFNATTLLNGPFLEKLKTSTLMVGGQPKAVPADKLPFALTLGIMIVSGSIMLWAAFTFFVAGVFFLGRLIELWVLIIFAPFAFMSFPIPLLKTVPYIGWDEWSKKLLATSFMAPVFMFFMYLIFKLLEANIFSSFTKGDGIVATILNVLIPAMIILALLREATKFAKKGGGAFGELAMAGAKIVGGLALGAATGGTALALTSTLGARAQRTANDDNLKKAASGDKEHFARMGVTDVNVQKKMQAAAQKKLATANKNANRSFDIRDTGVGKFVGSKTGMDFNKGTGALGLGTDKLKGGRAEQTKRKIEEEEKKKKTYEMSGSAADRQDDRAKQYLEDKEAAREYQNINGLKFDEAMFKAKYEAGSKLEYGLNKTVDGGRVDTSKNVNSDRKKAYINSLEDAATKEAAKNSLLTFKDEFTGEMKKMYTTAGGIAQTAALGAATGGVGLIAGPLAFSLARAIKTTVAKKVIGDVRSTDAEVIAGFRKGPDEYKELIKKLKKDLEGGHGSKEDKKPAHITGSAPSAKTTGTAQEPPEGDHTPKH